MQWLGPLVLLAVAGCAAPGPGRDVELGPLRFDPPSVAVSVGQAVTWRVAEGASHHTVTVADPEGGPGATLADSGDVGPGATYRFLFEEAAVYDVYCRYHSQGAQGVFDPDEMTMRVNVR